MFTGQIHFTHLSQTEGRRDRDQHENHNTDVSSSVIINNHMTDIDEHQRSYSQLYIIQTPSIVLTLSVYSL